MFDQPWKPDLARMLELWLEAGVPLPLGPFEGEPRWLTIYTTLASASRVQPKEAAELAQLERHLIAVHRDEQAHLLCEGSEVAVAFRPGPALLLRPLLDAARERYAGWRRRVREELRYAREDGAQVPIELIASTRFHPRAWGPESAGELARAGLELRESRAARIASIRCALARGAGRDALEAIVALEACSRARDAGLGVFRAVALEQCGELRDALAAFARVSVGEPGVYYPALSLALAIALGDETRGREALRTIGARAEDAGGGERRALEDQLRGAASDVRVRLRVWRAAGAPLSSPCGRLLFELACHPIGAASRIAFLFLDPAARDR